MTAFVAITLMVAANSTGGWLDRFRSEPKQQQQYVQQAQPHQHVHQLQPHQHAPLLADGGNVLPPGPGDGWGFPNGNPDGYGWYDVKDYLPLGADRNAEYYFPRFFSVPPDQMFLPTYYNPYVTRGQRYVPFTGGGGWHPAGGPPPHSAELPFNPKDEAPYAGVPPTIPTLNGRSEAKPTNSGTSGLTP